MSKFPSNKTDLRNTVEVWVGNPCACETIVCCIGHKGGIVAFDVLQYWLWFRLNIFPWMERSIGHRAIRELLHIVQRWYMEATYVGILRLCIEPLRSILYGTYVYIYSAITFCFVETYFRKNKTGTKPNKVQFCCSRVIIFSWNNISDEKCLNCCIKIGQCIMRYSRIFSLFNSW